MLPKLRMQNLRGVHTLHSPPPPPEGPLIIPCFVETGDDPLRQRRGRHESRGEAASDDLPIQERRWEYGSTVQLILGGGSGGGEQFMADTPPAPHSKFWQNYLPSLKYHNPKVEMTVMRTGEHSGPATLTIEFGI